MAREGEREREGAVKRSSVIQSPTHGRCVIRRPVFIGTLRLVSHLDLMARPRYTVARMFRAVVCVERKKKKWGRFGGGGERKEDRRDGSVNAEAYEGNERTNVSSLVHTYGWKMEYV